MYVKHITVNDRRPLFPSSGVLTPSLGERVFIHLRYNIRGLSKKLHPHLYIVKSTFGAMREFVGYRIPTKIWEKLTTEEEIREYERT